MNYPKSLFKYSKFKNYSLDMIDRGYIYFCPANKLDDQFECLCSWEKYRNLDLEIVINMVKDSLSELGINIPKIPFSSFYDGTSLNNAKVIEFLKNNDSNLSENKINQEIDSIKHINTLFFSPEVEEGLKKIALMQDYIGICSLAESNTNQVMWAMYANNYNGYCIEYDMESFLIKNPIFKDDLLKVNYSLDREFNIINGILKYIYSGVFTNMRLPIVSYNENDLKNMLIKIATTKHLDWAFQKEWRFIGIPNDKSIILPIKAVYIGRKLSKTNTMKILQKCKKKGIPVFIQRDDYVTLEIKFNKVEDGQYDV